MKAVSRVTRPPNEILRALHTLLRARETSILLALTLVISVTTVKNPGFVFSSDGWRDLLLTPSILILVAVGSGIVIITRNIDLSVGSILGLTAYLTGRLFTDVSGIPMIVVFSLGILLGGLLGLLNGLLIAFVRVPALVITLGTLYAYRGVDVLWAGGNRISPVNLPKRFLDIGTGRFLTVPLLTIIAVILLSAVGWYMRNTRGGREFYALGSDPAAAELCGLAIAKRVLIAFTSCGALTGLAGVLYVARYATADSQTGSGWELNAIAAVVVGGVAIFGGSGTVWGAAIGAFLLLTINRALPVLGVQDFWQQAVVGALIIGAIVLDRFLSLRQSRHLLQARDGFHE